MGNNVIEWCDSLELSLQTLNTFFTEFKPKMKHLSSGYLPCPYYAPNFKANAISDRSIHLMNLHNNHYD